jgi:uncharacterized membrane protein
VSLLRQILRTRPRLFLAFGLGLLAGPLLPGDWAPVARALGAWNLAVWTYLGLTAWLMLRADQSHVRRFAELEDRGAAMILALLSLAALASLAAILVELAAVRALPAPQRLLHYALTGATVLGSWCLVGVLFTFHYARAWYRAPEGARPLHFADGEPHPAYVDFLYFSFTIAVAAQTSDVSVLTRALRRVVLAQSVLSFLFNAAIIGLSINIAAGLVGG